MKTPLLLLVSLLASCGEDVDVQAATKNAIDAAAGAAKLAVDEIAKIDISGLSPDALRQKGGEVLDWLEARLDEIEDSEAAKRVAAELEPVVDKIVVLAKMAGDELPSRTEVADRVDALRARYAGDSQVMETLDPVLKKLSDALR